MRWSSRRSPRVRDELRYHRDRLVDDYVAAGMDRHVYAWHRNGSPVAGFPVLVVDPTTLPSWMMVSPP